MCRDQRHPSAYDLRSQIIFSLLILLTERTVFLIITLNSLTEASTKEELTQISQCNYREEHGPPGGLGCSTRMLGSPRTDGGEMVHVAASGLSELQTLMGKGQG